LSGGRFADSTRRIASLAWPLFIGQISVVAFATVDTLLLGRHSAADLAALSVGSAAYITVFIGLMGVVLALGPIVGQLYGARQLEQAGRQLHQAVWLALGLSALGSALLLFPAPFMALAQMSAEQEARVRDYLAVLALSLPASLLFAAYRGFNNALSRPKAVMALQVAGLALKVPLSALLIHGVPVLGVPALGVVGCAVATAIVMWSQALMGLAVLRRDGFYEPFACGAGACTAPDRQALWTQLKLGVPMGLSILIEVSGFALMAVFIARLGTRRWPGTRSRPTWCR
jgi:MATE family multidrug resistance protein